MRYRSVILLLLLCHDASAEPLGRLFYTPEERQALEAQRQGGGLAPDAPAGNRVTLNGIVQRAGGKTTIWLNRVPRYQGEGMPGMPAAAGKNGQALVRLPDTGRAAVLKVGQTLDVSSGEIRDVYQRDPGGGAAAGPTPESKETSPPKAPKEAGYGK